MKVKFESENTWDKTKVSMDFNTASLDVMLDQFKLFLLATGFVLDPYQEVIIENTSIKEDTLND